MANKICAVTEASDKFFHLTRLSVYSFIEHNRWFDGTLKLIVHQDLPLSQHNLLILKLIYPTIEIISISAQTTNKIKQVTSFRNSNKYFDILSNALKIFAFTLTSTKFVYFSNQCLFLNNVSNILIPGKITCDSNFSIAYVDGEALNVQLDSNNIPQFEDFISTLERTILPNLSLYSAVAPDAKFNHMPESKLKSFPCIVFNTFTSESARYSKINRIWLHKNHEILNNLQKPSTYASVVLEKKPNTIKSKSILSKIKVISPVIQDNIDSNSEMSSKINNFIKISKIEESNNQYALSKDLLFASIQDMQLIFDSNFSDSPIKLGYLTACIIAFKDRHEIMELNVRTLNEQSLIPAIVLVVSNIEDSIFARQLKLKYDNVFVTHYQNYPIGGKWNAGVKYAQKLKVNGVMILGSDDLLSLNYFETCYSKIDQGKGSSGLGVDLIGNRNWMIYDTANKLYSLSYLPNVSIFLGGGKMFSKYFLDSVDWQIFRKYRPFHLDEYGYNLVKGFSNKMTVISSDHFILSIKGDWDVINSSSDILRAKNRIKSHNITPKIKQIFNSLNIQLINGKII